MQELIEYIAKSLVERPEAVKVVLLPEGGRTIVRLQVAPADMGKVIGKGGRIAEAMRTLLKVASAREGTRAVLEIAPEE